MRTLEQHEQLISEFYELDKQGRTNILCPKCEETELRYSDSTILCSSPPKKRVFCRNCKYRTTITVYK